jgi:predicted RNase H-like nuclease
VAVGRLDGRGTPTVTVVASLQDLISSVDRNELAVAAIDIPIGLPDRGPRRCDIEAPRRLGPRRNSVFPAPVRAVLGCTTWHEANARAREVDGRGLSHQVFNLLHKIGEVDSLVTPARQLHVVEAHPELGFAAMSGAPLTHAKRTLSGRSQRIALLGTPVRAMPGAALDDVIDAHALLWTARRVGCGAEDRLGGAERDGRGLRMEIVY